MLILIMLVEIIEKASELLPNKEALVDGSVCQGKIDPKVIEMMYKMFPPGSSTWSKPRARCAT